MKNSKRMIAIIIALVLVIAGGVLTGIGSNGRSIYNEATEILGCKQPETITFIQDPSLIEEVERQLPAETYTKFLVKRLGADAAAVETAVSEHVVYDQKLLEAKDEAVLAAYIAETQGITEEEAQAIAGDKKQAGAIRDEMVAATVMAELGCDLAHANALAADADMIALLQDGFAKLMNGEAPSSKLFHSAIGLFIIGLVLLIFGLAILFIMWIENAGTRAKKGGAKANAKSKKVAEFFLNYALYIILVAILVAVCIAKPKFLDITNILNILKQSSTKGILALGCAGLIVLAGTDLSIGRVLGLSAAVTASLVQAVDYSSRMFPQMTTQLNLLIPLLASIAVAVIFALINGFGVAKLHLHAFIITLGTQLIAQGLCCIYIESQPSGTAQALSTFDRNFLAKAAGNLTIGNVRIPLVVIYFLLIAVIMWFIWNKTRLGKNMFAVGGNTEAAAVSGVNVAKTIMLVYLIAGVLYGISAFLEAARITSVGANTGLNYETDAISACVVGGVSFSGGVGTIQGVVIGAVILQAINYSLQFLGVNPYLQYVIRGLIIILAVAIDVRKYIAKK